MNPLLPPALSRRYAYHAEVYESHARRVEQAILRASAADDPSDRARSAVSRLPDLPSSALVNKALAPFGLSFVIVDSGYTATSGRSRLASVALVDSATRQVAARGTGSDTFDAYQNLRAGLGWVRPKYTTGPAVIVGTELED